MPDAQRSGGTQLKTIGTLAISSNEVRYLPSFERPGASQPPLFENRILQNMFFLSSSRAEPEITGSIARNDAN